MNVYTNVYLHKFIHIYYLNESCFVCKGNKSCFAICVYILLSGDLLLPAQ